MAKMESLEDLYVGQLRDIYYAEKQLLKALPKMAKKAENPELAEGFLQHAEETEGHVERLEQVFEMLELKARAEKCPAILGIVEEAKELMEEAEDEDTLNAALIMGAQKAEHYEIATYGTLVIWAKTLGYNDQAEILEETLAEEKACDEKLTMLAEAGINQQASEKEGKIAKKRAA